MRKLINNDLKWKITADDQATRSKKLKWLKKREIENRLPRETFRQKLQYFPGLF